VNRLVGQGRVVPVRVEDGLPANLEASNRSTLHLLTVARDPYLRPKWGRVPSPDASLVSLRELRVVAEHRRRADLAGPLRVEVDRSLERKAQPSKHAAARDAGLDHLLVGRVGRARPEAHGGQIVLGERHLLELRIDDRETKKARE